MRSVHDEKKKRREIVLATLRSSKQMNDLGAAAPSYAGAGCELAGSAVTAESSSRFDKTGLVYDFFIFELQKLFREPLSNLREEAVNCSAAHNEKGIH